MLEVAGGILLVIVGLWVLDLVLVGLFSFFGSGR